MKLALGTVQFGLDYGAFGSGIQISNLDVEKILNRATRAGVKILDTARAYGNSETVLGDVGAARRFSIVTKCPKLITDKDDPAEALLASFSESCSALGVNRVSGYLLHDARDLAREGVRSALQFLVSTGRVSRIGVSAYTYQEALQLCNEYSLTLIQLPANVLNPWYKGHRLPEHVEVHARSVFLQGFLLSDPGNLPKRFKIWSGVLRTFRARAAQLGLSPLQAALAPLLQCEGIHRVIVGVDSLHHLEQIIDAIERLESEPPADLGDYPEASAELTDPRAW